MIFILLVILLVPSCIIIASEPPLKKQRLAPMFEHRFPLLAIDEKSSQEERERIEKINAINKKITYIGWEESKPFIQKALNEGVHPDDIYSHDGKCALHAAISKDDAEFAQILLRYNARVHNQANRESFLHSAKSSLMTEVLQRYGAMFADERDAARGLHEAIKSTDRRANDLIAWYLHNRINIHGQDAQGTTALMALAQHAKHLSNQDINSRAKQLIGAGALRNNSSYEETLRIIRMNILKNNDAITENEKKYRSRRRLKNIETKYEKEREALTRKKENLEHLQKYLMSEYRLQRENEIKAIVPLLPELLNIIIKYDRL